MADIGTPSRDRKCLGPSETGSVQQESRAVRRQFQVLKGMALELQVMTSKQLDGAVRDRHPDIVQASDGYAVDVLTELKPDAVMQDQAEVEERMGSEVSVMEDGSAAALSEGKP